MRVRRRTSRSRGSVPTLLACRLEVLSTPAGGVAEHVTVDIMVAVLLVVDVLGRVVLAVASVRRSGGVAVAGRTVTDRLCDGVKQTQTGGLEQYADLDQSYDGDDESGRGDAGHGRRQQ